MRGAHIVILVVALLFLIAAGYGSFLAHHGFSAHEQPSAVETLVARQVRSLAVPTGAKQLKSPVLPTRENIQAGMSHWADHCPLHASNGNGDTDIGRNLYLDGCGALNANR